MDAIPPGLIPDDRLQKYRSLFPHIERGVIYLNHAAVSPLSKRVLDAQIGHLQDRSSGKIETYLDDIRQIESTRGCVRSLINAESTDRIAFAGNTSEAINVIASGIDWKQGDRILLNDQEFPSNVYPYHHLKSKGVEIDFLRCRDGRVTPELIYQAFTPRTRLLALSAVQYLSGYRADLALLGDVCRSKGILFIVDGIQGVGAIQLDVQVMKIDAMAAACPKWQMGPQGIGFLYLSEEMQARLHQRYKGWLSVEDPWNFTNFEQSLAPSARRYESGTINVPGMWGMHAALSTLLEVGPEKVEAHILGLTGALIREMRTADGVEIFSPESLTERAGIVTITPPATVDPSAAFEKLTRQNIFISLRNGKFRYSPHFYNTLEEIMSAADATKEVFRTLAGRYYATHF